MPYTMGNTICPCFGDTDGTSSSSEPAKLNPSKSLTSSMKQIHAVDDAVDRLKANEETVSLKIIIPSNHLLARFEHDLFLFSFNQKWISCRHK